MVERSLLQPGTRIICLREIQRSIAQSVKQLIEDKIEYFKVEQYFRPLKNEIKVAGGGIISFQGLQDHTAESIKSLEGYDVAWVEEAQTLSKRSNELLRPTIRKDGSELWYSWNPRHATDPVDVLLRGKNPPPDSIVIHARCKDNPWFPNTLKEEREHDYKIDPDNANHIWEGDYWSKSDAQVLNGKWSVEAFEPMEHWGGPYYGCDWGFAVDPTTLIRCWVADNILYIEYEAWGVGYELGPQTTRLFEKVPGARNHIIRADNARPESISLMKNQEGFNIVSVKKWPGSVEDGISHLRSYDKIIIHPRCEHTETEARLYRYKVDKQSGDVLPAIIDDNNHCIDPIRYALAPLIKHRAPWKGL